MKWIKRFFYKPLEQQLKLAAYLLGFTIVALFGKNISNRRLGNRKKIRKKTILKREQYPGSIAP